MNFFSVVFTFLVFLPAFGDPNRLIGYKDVKVIFENRCSACHNAHMNARNGLPNWSVESVANARREVIGQFVVDLQIMPKKWSAKFKDWPEAEQKVFKGWVEKLSFRDAGVDETIAIAPTVPWPTVNDADVDRIFRNRDCNYCEETKEKMNATNKQELGSQMYWRVFYLGMPPHSEDERKSYLLWTFDELTAVASWLRSTCQVDVSQQWIKVRSELVRQ